MERAIVIIDGLVLCVTYVIEREERENGRIRIPESVYIDSIHVDSFDAPDIAGLLYKYDAYEPLCEDIEKEMEKQGIIN